MVWALATADARSPAARAVAGSAIPVVSAMKPQEASRGGVSSVRAPAVPFQVHKYCDSSFPLLAIPSWLSNSSFNT